MYIIDNPFAGWAHYLVDAHGRIVGYSNSLEWCERMIARLYGR